MIAEVQIRRFEPDDLAAAEALGQRTPAIRPEEQPLVEPMFERAREAEANGERWLPVPKPDGPSRNSAEYAAANYRALWVAVVGGEVVGMIGVADVGLGDLMPPDMPKATEWRNNGSVAELKMLRVAPELHRQGIGSRLTQTVIDWSRDHGYRKLILDTTSPQLPARTMYEAQGFRAADTSYVGQWELIWYELDL